MKTLGIITAGLGLTAGAVAVVVGVQSIPDLRRYFKMRSM